MYRPLITEQRPVVVVVDGSPAGASALRWAVDHAATLGQPVRAVMIVSPTAFALAGIDGIAFLGERDAFDDAVALERVIERAIPEPETREAIDRRVVVGPGIDRLLDEAQDASVLVVGQGGRSLAHRLVSITRALVAQATCPVVVVPKMERSRHPRPWADKALARPEERPLVPAGSMR